MNLTHVCFLFWGILSASAAQVPDKFSDNLQPSDYLIKIADSPSDREEFLYILNKNRQNQEGALSKTEFEENFNLFIDYKLKVKHAMELGLDKSEEFQTEFESFQKELIKPYLLENDLQEGELRRVYDRMQEMVKASHILLQFPPNASTEDSIAVFRMAEKLKAAAENGEDFSELAVLHSEDPSAQTNKGNLGYFTALQMVLPFEEAAYSLSVGEISDPVISNFGYHIIRLEDRRPNPGQLRVSHLLIRINPEQPETEALAQRKIAELYQKVQANPETWQELVSTFSEDTGSKSNLGLVPWFGVGSLVPEFEQAAFSLDSPGAISRPVKTQYGYHLLRLEDQRPVPPFEEAMPTIKSRILRDSRSEMLRSQVLAQQKSKFGVRENSALWKKIEELVRSSQGKAAGVLLGSLETAEWKQDSLVWSEGKQANSQDFARFLESQIGSTESVVQQPFDFWYERFITALLSEWEEAHLYASNQEYRQLVNEYRNGMLLFELMNNEVWQKAVDDSLGQRYYFQGNRETYRWEERLPALILKADAGKDLSEVKSWLSAQPYSEELEEKVKERFLREDPLKFTHEQGVFEISKKEILSKLNPDQSFHTITKNGETILVVTGKKIPAKLKAFEETRGKLIQDYQQFLEKNLLATLRKTYTIQINEDEKETTYRELEK
ncbi:peptidylprolyl isomerase [Cyclobacterium jeungdonense]|uniref:Peptidylprolyl isomerase n=1 Tax=Cyclobacterium jeungdonense TaxID=708087 RepID=A0ABT8C605_9BACT|nr:peptidylprolyl isomerase [Cyclobacterium jeungdonense]MDN3687213.1 peptidylprolyl isomerase [Cyclobacterium jeungdonense]